MRIDVITVYPEMIEGFCHNYLNDEDMELSLKVVDEMASTKNPYYERGSL